MLCFCPLICILAAQLETAHWYLEKMGKYFDYVKIINGSRQAQMKFSNPQV